MIRLIKALGRRILWACYAIIMIVFRVFPINDNKVVVVNYFGKGYGDNAKYILERLLGINKQLDLVWALQNMSDFLPKEVRPVKYMSLKYFYELSTAKVWVDNCRKQAYIKKRKGQYYIQTWHGDIGPKKVEGEAIHDLYNSYIKAAKKDSKMADLFVSGNASFSERYRTAFWYYGEIAECGYPRRDILFSMVEDSKKSIMESIGIPKGCKIVLYAPTFRSGDVDLSMYMLNWSDVIESLAKRFGGDWIVLVRLHPNISELSSKLMLPKEAIDVTNYPDMQELLAVSDVCISDYSSSLFEFAVTGRPGFICAKDYLKYKEGRDVYIELDKTFFPFAQSEEELLRSIEQFDDSVYQERLFDFLHNQIGYLEDGHASEYIGNVIISKCDCAKETE